MLIVAKWAFAIALSTVGAYLGGFLPRLSGTKTEERLFGLLEDQLKRCGPAHLQASCPACTCPPTGHSSWQVTLLIIASFAIGICVGRVRAIPFRLRPHFFDRVEPRAIEAEAPLRARRGIRVVD